MKPAVIPAEDEPLDFARDKLREAKWRDLLMNWTYEQVPPLRAFGASVGMTMQMKPPTYRQAHAN